MVKARKARADICKLRDDFDDPSVLRRLFGGQLNEVEDLHLEHSSEARQSQPGEVLLAVLYPRHGVRR